MYENVFTDTMAELKWQEIEKHAAMKAAVLFPLGVIEEHGPHIPLGSDIYWSYAMSRLVKEELKKGGREALIAPPYYWGVNHCTEAFPGTFSLKPETMEQVLLEILGNLRSFGFDEVYCFNYHGDAAHVNAAVNAIRNANEKLQMSVRLVLNSMDLGLFGWRGDEDFLLVCDPEYPMEFFEGADPAEEGLYDIHAGAFETAAMDLFCGELVDLKAAETLKSASLDSEGLQKWLCGGEVMKGFLPLGYAGNPAGYGFVKKHMTEIVELQVRDIVKKIILTEDTNQK